MEQVQARTPRATEGAGRAGLLFVAWLAIAGMAGFVAARALGLTDRHSELFALATLTPWLLLPCGAALVLAAVLRARALAVASVLLLAVTAAWVAPDLRWWSTAAAVEGPTTVVAAANVGPEHRRAAEMAADLVTIEADVLNVVELTPVDQAALRAAGIHERYPHSFEAPRSGGFGSGIYSRYPVRDGRVLRVAGTPMASAVVELPSGPTTVIAVHTSQPLTDAGRLAAELEELGRIVRDSDGPVVLAGDFNATRQHQPFRSLLEVGLTDAHLATGRGWSATWPTDRRIPPFALIDHVLVSRELTAASAGEITIRGTDHRAVVATIGRAAR